MFLAFSNRRLSVSAASLLFFFVIGLSACNATIVATACSRDGVILVADGLVLQPGSTPPSIKGCKITQGADSCFFSILGVRDMKSINYDLTPMAKYACRSGGSIVERAMAFEQMALPEVQRMWKYVKAHKPETYATVSRAGSARVQVVFAGGPPFTVAVVGYVEDSLGNVVVDEAKSNVCDFASKADYEVIGVSENVEVYHAEHREIEELDDIGLLRALVLGAIELEGKPKRIGPPIAILQINADGAKWIDRGLCQEIKHR